MYIYLPSVFPLKIFRMGQIYKFVYKSWWPSAKSIHFWLRSGWMNKKSTFLSLFLKFFWSNLPTHWAKIATYGLRGSTAYHVCKVASFISAYCTVPIINHDPLYHTFSEWDLYFIVNYFMFIIICLWYVKIFKSYFLYPVISWQIWT